MNILVMNINESEYNVLAVGSCINFYNKDVLHCSKTPVFYQYSQIRGAGQRFQWT